jgi:hypothetical protein
MVGTNLMKSMETLPPLWLKYWCLIKLSNATSVTLFMTFALNILKPLSANSFVFDLYNLAKTSLGIQGQLGLTLQVR